MQKGRGQNALRGSKKCPTQGQAELASCKTESSDGLQSSGSAAALPVRGPPSPSSLSLFTSEKVTREWRQGITPTSPPSPSPGKEGILDRT